MSTCKDCIHHEVCEGYLPTDLDEDIWDLCAEGKSDEIHNIDERCDQFKDKSKFIELPCSIGDIVYELDVIVDDEFCSTCEYYTPEYPGDPEWCEKTCAFHRAKECIKIEERKTTFRSIVNWMLCDEFGKTVFLTREEAEKRLHEINGTQ